MTYAELTRRLRALGCERKRQGRGSHEIWHNPRTNRSASLPRHAGDLPPGTLHAIVRGLGLTRARAAALGSLARAVTADPDLFGPRRSLECGDTDAIEISDECQTIPGDRK